MESSDVMVYDHRLSSVVPASITGEDRVASLTNVDLAMKLHYLRGVYLFRSEAVEGKTVKDLKDPLFWLLEMYFPAAGRIRRSPDGGRPFVKCNDSGVRIVEAKCNRTVDELMDIMNDENPSRFDHLLHHDQVLGPDLGFSPLVFIQFTWFKCGGLSVGLSWAHVLGDAFTLTDFINNFGKAMQTKTNFSPNNNKIINNHLNFPTTNEHINNYSPKKRDQKFPLSLGKIDNVGDLWKITNSSKMATHSYHVTDQHLNDLILKISGTENLSGSIKAFEVISAMIWKTLARVKCSELKTVTIVKNDFCDRVNDNNDQLLPSNNQVIGVVKAELNVGEADVSELAELMVENAVDERGIIMEEELGDNDDLYVYGANLTFVNFEGAKMYGFEMKGQKPIYANLGIGGVGDEGAVLVGPSRPTKHGKIVNLILPEDTLVGLKSELPKNWGALFEN